MEWLTIAAREDVEAIWPGAIGVADDTLAAYLAAAAESCEAFAPNLPAGTAFPASWATAQILQARAIARAGRTGAGDQEGGFGETVTVFPMDWQVKQLLRPIGVPKVR